MYVPPHFRLDDPEALAAFMERHAFATLVTLHDGAPFATHLPMLVERRDDGLALVAHMARANPQWRDFRNQDVLVIFAGPHAYVSPSWYREPKSVPTWNYATAHVYGRAYVVEDRDAVYDVLQRLTEREERGRPAPWRTETLPPDYVATMMQAIVAFTIVPTRIEGKYKLSQNRDRDDRESVARQLGTSDREADRETAAMMRETLR